MQTLTYLSSTFEMSRIQATILDALPRGSGIRRLPSELHCMVIDQLSDDKESLASCSLVSRAWTSPSRVQLFREVTLSASAEHPSRFTDFLRFLQITDASTSRVGRYIVDLGFEGLIPEYNEYRDDMGKVYKQYMPLSLDTLRSLLHLLPRIGGLYFHHILFIDLSRDLEAACDDEACDTNPALNALSIANCSAPSMSLQVFSKVVSMFSEIGDLTVVSGPWESTVQEGGGRGAGVSDG